MAGRLYIGTSGYVYKDWRGIFYPRGVAQKNWLSFYAERFNTVEINATFYGHFARSVFERWRALTPPSFIFTLKGPRPITHVKRLEDVGEQINRFWDSAQGLGDKLSAMLWQFPPSFHYNSPDDKARLAHFMRLVPPGLCHVYEFRHASWFKQEIYDLLDSHQAAFCINDSSRFPAREVVTGGCVYVRFHGPQQLYASLYTPEQLAAWAEKLRPYLPHYDVYCYFNNDYGGRALQNARELRDLLDANTGKDTP